MNQANASLSETLKRANDALDKMRPEDALELLEPFADQTSAEFLACLIEAQCMTRRFELADATVARALALYPDNVGIMHAAGLNLFHQRDYSRATEWLRTAIRTLPTYAMAYNNLGMVLEHMHQTGEVEALYKEAMRCDPTLTSAYKNLGRLAELAGRIEDARTFYEQGRLHTRAAEEFSKLLAGVGSNFAAPQVNSKSDTQAAEDFLATELARVARAHLRADHKAVVLDLICGAGTMGNMLWRDVGLMIGVDPRIHLLQAAQAQNIYFDLKNQYPSAYLKSCKRGETDLITANCAFADQGDLLPVFLNLYAVLAANGLLVTVYPTQTDQLGYFIEGAGSFSHDPRYVLARADFEGMQLLERIDYSPETHPGVDRTYTLMAFIKPS
jgi:predicted TPR repeat methyltransferase